MTREREYGGNAHGFATKNFGANELAQEHIWIICGGGSIRSRGVSHTNLSIESLEDRCLLAGGAIGSFEKTGGLATASSDAFVILSTLPNSIADVDLQQDTILARAATRAIGSDPFGFGVVQGGSIALVPTPIGGTISVPQVSGSSSYQATAIGAAIAITRGNSFDAGGVFQNYVLSNPELYQNLRFIGHLFIAGGAVQGEVDGGVAAMQGGVSASIDGLFVRAAPTGRGDQIWPVTTNIPNVVLPPDSVGGVNLHIILEFTITVAPGGGIAGVPTIFQASGGAIVSANGNVTGTATANKGLAAGAWGYVTADGYEPAPGDFNYDGVVNALDYEVWADGKPQADGNLDGKIDKLDYAIWAQNANAILVTTNVDENNGTANGIVSLREAIALAADVNHPGSDIIAFHGSLLGQTITLSSGLTIASTNPVQILGPGADQLTINGNGANINIINVSSASTISHLKLTGATGTAGAGVGFSGNNSVVLDSLDIVGNRFGVRNNSSGTGQLSIVDSLIANNSRDGISGGPSGYYGGKVIVTNSTISNNAQSGINLFNIDATISGSEISGNKSVAGSSSFSGIVFASDDSFVPATLSIIDSTIAGTQNSGRGIVLDSSTATIVNSTISNNTGVGLSVFSGTATLTNVTITQNRGVSTQTGGVQTGGIYAGNGGTVKLYNTIVAQNFAAAAPNQTEADLGKAATGSFFVGTSPSHSSYNLIGVVGNSLVTSINNNIILAGASAGLVALGDYGGKTRTHALLSTSLAIDHGDNAKATAIGLLYDQRGEGYDRIVDWDGDLNARVDIGAFEVALGEFYS